MNFSCKFLALVTLVLLSTGCSLQKRIYHKGYFVQWHQKALLVTHSKENSSTWHYTKPEIFPSAPVSIVEPLIIPEVKFSPSPANPKQIPKYTPEPLLKLTADTTIKKSPITGEAARQASRSYTFGLLSLICSLLFFIFIVSYPLAAIFGSIAIRNGRKVLPQVGTNQPDEEVARKARQGIRMGLLSFIFINTALLIAGLTFVLLLYLLLTMFASFTIYGWLLVFVTALAIILATLLVLWYVFTLNRILKQYP